MRSVIIAILVIAAIIMLNLAPEQVWDCLPWLAVGMVFAAILTVLDGLHEETKIQAEHDEHRDNAV